MLVFPAGTAQAATKQRYYRAYISELKGFLVNYRANTSNRQGCARTNQKPDGLTSDCLSQKKVAQIMNQLWIDGYFEKRAAADRRTYLFTTKKQPYVMKKVVMYFEQILNPDTVVYGSTINRSVTSILSDGVLDALKTAAHYTLGSKLPQDSVLLSLAVDRRMISDGGFGQEDIYEYSLKPKAQITQASLDKIYATDRMKPYAGMNSPASPDWTANELEALQYIVNLGNEVINYAKTYKTTPRIALITVQAQAMAMGSVGASGRVGGAAVGKVGVLSQANRATYTIGRATATVDERVLARAFSNSYEVTRLVDAYVPETGGRTLINPALRKMGMAAEAMDVAYQYNHRVFPGGAGMDDLDLLLVETIENKYNFASSNYFKNVLGKSDYIPGTHLNGNGTIWIRDRGDVFKTDLDGYWFEPSSNLRLHVHETIHNVRWWGQLRKGFSHDSSIGLEDLTEWLTQKSLSPQGVIISSDLVSYHPEYIEQIARKMAQRNGWTLQQAQSTLTWINSNASPYVLDYHMGSGFWDEYINARNLLERSQREYVTTPDLRKFKVSEIARAKQTITDLIASR